MIVLDVMLPDGGGLELFPRTENALSRSHPLFDGARRKPGYCGWLARRWERLAGKAL